MELILQKLKVVYNKGSVAEASSSSFVLDTAPATAGIRAADTGFSPKGGGFRKTMDFALLLLHMRDLLPGDNLISPQGKEDTLSSGKGTCLNPTPMAR